MTEQNNITEKLDTLSLARKAAALLIEHKGISVRMFDVSHDSSVTDYYVNATGSSRSQIEGLCDILDEKISLLGRTPLRIEGRGAGSTWILMDYGDVIVNIFDRPSRDFYNFDRLLPETGEVDISDIIAEIDEKYGVDN